MTRSVQLPLRSRSTNDATGKDTTIVVRNGDLNKTYDPTATNNPLNLSADKYKFLPSDNG